MVNYYTKFWKFIEAENIKSGIDLDVFKNKMIIYFGFCSRKNTVKRWLVNFESAGLIKIVKVPYTVNWVVNIQGI